MLTVDGSQGEGGGQVLRTSLALSMVTGTPFRIVRIRAGRAKPGLLRQHLTAVAAAQAVSGADVEGAQVSSETLEFRPGRVRGGEHHFAIGSAGSTTLVVQTVLPALLSARERAVLSVEGGTHNPKAPPFEFFAHAFLPLAQRLGARVSAALERPGYYPAGGGRLRVSVEPAEALSGFELLERGELRDLEGVATVAHLPGGIAERELAVLRTAFASEGARFRVERHRRSAGPGNVLTLRAEHAWVTEVFSAYGERGVSAEQVAEALIREAKEYFRTPAPVGSHLADQLALLLAVCGGGRFRTLAPTPHTLTQLQVIQTFLGLSSAVIEEGAGVFCVSVGR
jgi:RNA 3'-terminal phosphate cyclase (ATP)